MFKKSKSKKGKAKKVTIEVAVLGSGPGGYTAAFRAADLGKKVLLIERFETIGGVCLNVGCIPSKALLHTAKVIDEVEHQSQFGLNYKSSGFDINKIKDWKDGIVTRLTTGLTGLAKQRKVEVITGVGKFISKDEILVEGESGSTLVKFENAVIAAGSQPTKLPFIPEDPRIMDSTDALELPSVKGELLVLGGGIIGLEMATVYNALGAKVTVVELLDMLIPGADKDVVMPLHKRIAKQYENILLNTKVIAVDAFFFGFCFS